MKHGQQTSGNRKGNMRDQHSFAKIPSIEHQRSQFNRSHGLKTTFDAAELIPILWDEALPGDTVNCRMASFARLSTPLFPVMDNLFLDFFFFFVPNRLVWDNWEKFCGAQDDPGDSVDFTVPNMISIGNADSDSLYAYFGLPVGQGQLDMSALHFRAYNLIWNEWFRDQNLQDSAPIKTGDTGDVTSDYKILKRGKRHDYFTSCLPFTQKGTAVTLPIGSVAPVVSKGDGIPVFDGTGWSGTQFLESAGSGDGVDWTAAPGTEAAAFWDDPKLEADLSSATASTINDIRQAFQIQRLLERDARGGTRYTEVIKAHFGVISPDQRLQRPEYLGGGTTQINIHAVSAATGGGGGTPNVGTLSGFGTAAADGVGFVKSFTEHGVIIGLVNMRADITYQNGIERMWSRQTRFDFFWPALSHIGEQAVLNKEIFWSNVPATDDATFGFQERYAEYRYKQSRVTGKFYSNASASLDAWHVALDFSSLPTLNDVFIEDQPPIDRVIGVPAEPHIIGDFYFSYICARPMPTFSVPGMIDHF